MRAIIYSRVSTDAQERDGTSLDTQERASLEYAQQAGYRVVRAIRDTGSGASLERPGIVEVRRLMRDGMCDVLIGYALDRLSRDQNHVGVLLAEAEDAGVRIELVTESFEETAIGKFIVAARAFIAEVEREKIAERTMRGKEERARSGRLPQGTGRGMFGYIYDSDTGRRVVNEEQAAVVRRVFGDFMAGASLIGITNSLNEQGIPSFTGGRWHTWTVKNMLRNPGYAGRTIFNRRKVEYGRDRLTGKRRRTVALRDESEWIEVPDATPPIVTEELFSAVQARLVDPERRRHAQRKYDYPLGGLIRCARCNGAMVGQTSLGKYRYYRCRRAYAGPRHDRCPSRYLRAADLERAVARELMMVLASPDVVLAELERASSDGARDDDLAAAQQLLASLDDQRQRVLKLFQMGEVDEAYLQRELETLRARRSPAETTIAELDSLRSGPRVPVNPKEFAATCDVLRERVAQEIKAGRLKEVAQAMQISITVERTDEGASGALEGVIPHEIGRFGGDFSHHCTNIGMTTWT